MKLFAKFLVPMAALALGGAACGKKAPVEPTPAEVTAAPAPEADAAAPAPDAAAEPAPDAAAVAPDAAAAPEGDVAAMAGDAAAAAPEGDAVAAAADGAVAAADAVAEVVDYVRVVLNHHDTAKGFVTADFKTFKVLEANLEFKKPGAVKVVLEVDTSSVSTGVPDRDTHVKSPDFLDVAKFATATITVTNVNEVAEMANNFTATATVDLHGIKKEIPVGFKIVEEKEDGSIVIEGEVKDVARADFGMALPADKVNVADVFTAQIRLTVKTVVPAPVPE